MFPTGQGVNVGDVMRWDGITWKAEGIIARGTYVPVFSGLFGLSGVGIVNNTFGWVQYLTQTVVVFGSVFWAADGSATAPRGFGFNLPISGFQTTPEARAGAANALSTGNVIVPSYLAGTNNPGNTDCFIYVQADPSVQGTVNFAFHYVRDP